jgi:type IV pilus assembly protein PilF
MRLEWLGACAMTLALSGCVTTGGESSSTLSDKMPHTSQADESKDAARIHTELGQQYMANGELQAALEKLNKALQFDPDYAPAHTVIAVLYERINNLPAAEQHYRKAVELEPRKGDPNNNLGAFLCKIGKPAEAEGYFQKAVADPFYHTPDVAWTNQGVCQARAHDLAGAQASFRKAVALNPQNGEALYQLADMLYRDNDLLHARAFIQRFDSLGQPTAAGLKLGHDIESRVGNTDAALNYSRRLQAQFPDSEQAHALDATVSP